MAKLDIIVPHYKEDIGLMDPMLGILKLQRNVDFDSFRVVVVCDGMDIEMPAGWGSDLPFAVAIHRVEHGGISAARNAGLDFSDAEWVCFCDSDDAFLTTNSLWVLMDAMRDGINMITSEFYGETVNEHGTLVKLSEFNGTDSVFVHGKVFRRQWLVDNGIRFDSELALHEDTYFITLAEFMCGERELKILKYPTYLWQHNGKSVTRLYDDFTLQTFEHWAKKTRHLVGELARRRMYGCVRIVLCDAVVDSYASFNSYRWNLPRFDGLRKRALGIFDEWLAEYADSVANLPAEMINKRLEYRCTADFGFIPGSPSFGEWISERMK